MNILPMKIYAVTVLSREPYGGEPWEDIPERLVGLAADRRSANALLRNDQAQHDGISEHYYAIRPQEIFSLDTLYASRTKRGAAR